ncbi:MAG: DUF262 domain-containing protein [Bacteroidales bacterium]|nr:DUF262 domain-containing protein [Bacteroidales bacterium]
MNATITLREYIEKGKTFVIPNYQRGYVWGKKSKKNDLDAVSFILVKSLIPGFNNNTPVFIQGITVTETDKDIILIDGQQRTTFFYLLLKYLGYSGKVEMKYDIRDESNKFLSELDINETDFSENTEEEFQDRYFFKKTLRTINENLVQIEKEEFCNYILDYVRFLYIDIPDDKATKVFSMMNGSKAEMKSEELIKAELLRLASLNDSDFDKKEEKEKNAIEWDNNMLRSRYAREWDKWLQWWNREDVKKLFKCSNVMGYLVSSYLQTKDKSKELSFDNFKNLFLLEQNPIDAKKTFDGLRRLQKRFEDAFNNPKIYNWVGAILRIGSANEFIQWYFVDDNKPSDEDLENYYKWSFLGLTHKEIETHRLALNGDNDPNDNDKFDVKFDELYKILESNSLYNENSEAAFRLLLRLNIDEDNKQEEGFGRNFDFSIWDRKDYRGRSLEHIYPKSKVLHKELKDGNRIIKNGKEDIFGSLPKKSDGYIARASCRYFENSDRIEASEHSIGNLVLLYKDDNSSFNDSSFEEKKSMFFMVPDGKDKKKKMMFKSRHLLHTIYKFAQSEWKGEEIAKNKYQTLKEFREYYGK